MINIVIGRMIFEGKESIWIVGAYHEFWRALRAKNADYWRLVGDSDQEAAMKHLPHYDIIRVPANEPCIKELQ